MNQTKPTRFRASKIAEWRVESGEWRVGGETCKIVSLGIIVERFADKPAIKPPYLYKTTTFGLNYNLEIHFNPHSLRKLAKKHGSVQGEVPNKQLLIELARDAGLEIEV